MSANSKKRQAHRQHAAALAAEKPQVRLTAVNARTAALALPGGREFTGSWGDICSILRCEDDAAMHARVDAIERRIAMRPDHRRSASVTVRPDDLRDMPGLGYSRRRSNSGSWNESSSDRGCGTTAAVVAAAVFFGG